MCSVVGCDSWRRSAQRFKLPEDPERRLEWVQFLATVNKQRFKESSWTEITICSEHFTDDCFFANRATGHSDMTVKVQLSINSRAVPSLCLQSGPDEPEPSLESPNCVEPRGRMQPKHVNMDLIREKAALLQMKGKCVVNEKRLLQLFSCKCPSCGCQLQMEKVTHGVLVILNQRCLQCEYRYQWKSQVNASVPTAEDQHPAGGTEVKPETQQAAPTDHTHSSITGVPEIVAVVDEESDPMDEESSDQGDMDSDEDWKPVKDFFPARVLQKKPDNDTEDDGEEEEEHDDYPHLAPKHSQLCTDCGMFFSRRWPHTCEHKIKPYPCNICGKRCVSEVALNRHSRIHDANYEHRCKYCHVTFKTKVDKITHEQIHLTQGKPYKCPDCSETFATNKERKVHLEDHRGPQQLKCDICGIEFLWPLALQRHLTVHSGVKPYKCSVCQRGFKQAGHLKSHMRLHTGERPYKCQHCDKCFNHNVSLKSHVQRYHSSSSGCEQKKEKINERESDTGDAQDNGIKRGADSGLDNVEEEQDTEDEEQNERIYGSKKKRKTTGRPIGRPKNYESGNSILAVQEEGQCSNTKSGKPQVRKLKRRQGSDEESEDKPSDSDTSVEAGEEEEARSEKGTTRPSRSRRRANDSDSDSDFDPEDSKKKMYSSQNSGKSSGKRRGRPRKNLEV